MPRRRGVGWAISRSPTCYAPGLPEVSFTRATGSRRCASWPPSLGVNVNTVARAYAELAREGVLVSHAGGGTRVAATAEAGLFKRAREARLQELVGGVVLQALGLGYRPEQIEATLLDQMTRWSAVEPAEQSEPPVAEPGLLFAGSHDPTLELLAARLRRRNPPVWLSTNFSGSLEGLMALAHGQTHLAGCHLLDELTGDYNAPFVARLLPGQAVLLVTLAQRDQGFIVRPGNPSGVTTMADLLRPGISFAGRQRGSGTQVLLEFGLRRAGLDPTALQTDGPDLPHSQRGGRSGCRRRGNRWPGHPRRGSRLRVGFRTGRDGALRAGDTGAAGGGARPASDPGDAGGGGLPAHGSGAWRLRHRRGGPASPGRRIEQNSGLGEKRVQLSVDVAFRPVLSAAHGLYTDGASRPDGRVGGAGSSDQSGGGTRAAERAFATSRRQPKPFAQPGCRRGCASPDGRSAQRERQGADPGDDDQHSGFRPARRAGADV